MSFLVAGAIIGGGALIAGGSAIHGNRQAKKVEKKVQQQAGQQQIAAANTYNALQQQGRPEMNAQVDRLQSIYDLAQQGMPDEVRSNAEMNIAQSQSQALRDLGERGGGVRGAGMVQGQTNQAYRDLNSQDAQMRMNNTMQVGVQLARAEADAEFYNKLTPYEQMVQQYQALLGASQQNSMLATNMQAQRGQANAQVGMDIGGSIMGLGTAMLGDPTGMMGLAGGGGGSTPQLNANRRIKTTGRPPKL
jgi:hypothetical protein